MSEKELFALFDDTAPIRPVYYEERWMALPLLHLYKQQIKPFAVEGVPRNPLKRSVKERDKLCSSLTETLIPSSLKYEELIKLCKRHSIPTRWVVPPIYTEHPRRRNGGSRRGDIEEAKNQPLTKEEYKKIEIELKKIDPQTELLLKTLWEVNKGGNILELNGSVQYVTLEDILQLQIEDLPREDAEDAGWLIFRCYGKSDGEKSVRISKRLWNALCIHVQGRCLFVFSNSKGTPLFPVQINKYLRMAAKRCRVREGKISSLSYRSYPCEEIQKIFVRIRDMSDPANDPFPPIGNDQWEQVLREFPEIIEKAGRKASYRPLDLLNAIFYRMRHRCAVRDLPQAFPPWRAVDSQYRRWKKNGVFDKICKFLSLLRSPH